jgi:hypothetical protein
MQSALLRYYANAIKIIVMQHTQQELLRYYGNLICHIAPSLRLLVPSSPPGMAPISPHEPQSSSL